MLAIGIASQAGSKAGNFGNEVDDLGADAVISSQDSNKLYIG
jgi:hypothetical protein